MFAKSNWKCFQLKDSSVYFGEIVYVKSNGDIALEEAVTADEKNTLKKIRHGFGVQLFLNSSGHVLCKYEGGWKNDKKSGHGLCSFPNGDIYQGNLHNDKRHGTGTYQWANGKKYEGDWKQDRMEGSGVFIHTPDFKLQGLFNANYYLFKDLAINPFLDEDKLQEEIKLQEKHKEKTAKRLDKLKTEVTLHRIPNLTNLAEALLKVDNSGRIGCILTTQQSFLRKSEVIETLRRSNRQVFELDLKGLAQLKKEEGKESVRSSMRSIVADALTTGGILLLNLDDTSSNYDELYYPDIQEFYHPTSFPPYLFRPKEFQEKEEI